MSIEALAGAGGAIVGVAVDHRDSFRAALHARGLDGGDDQLVRAIKADVCRVLRADATFLLVDAPEFAAGAPFVMPLEAQGYGELHAVEQTTLLDAPTIGAMSALGVQALKLLLPLRPDIEDRAERQHAVAAAAIARCHAEGLPLILEPIVWRAPGEQLEDERFAELVVEAARQLSPLRPGLLKLQYPGSWTACVQLHAACAGHPWVLLGGGAQLAELSRQVTQACMAGARGCIVGRSLFHGALDADPSVRARYLRDIARPALEGLASAVVRARRT